MVDGATEPRPPDLDRVPVSIKGVVLADDGRVLLGRNDRHEWELLGGRIEAGEHPRETLQREVMEEAGLTVDVDERPLDAMLFDVLGNGVSHVFIVAYRCWSAGATTTTASAEHQALGWFDLGASGELDDLPTVYKRCITAATGSETSA